MLLRTTVRGLGQRSQGDTDSGGPDLSLRTGQENEGISYKWDHRSSPWQCVWREVLGLILS